MNPHLLPKVRSEQLMQSARGMQCALRLPGFCWHRPDTVVMAHLPGIGKGVSTKVSDIHGAFACAGCHDAIDRHIYERHGLTKEYVLEAMLRAHCETQAQWIGAGLLIVPGAKII